MSRIAVLWRGGEPCIHSFALREDHRTALIMKILYNSRQSFPSGLRKPWRGGKIKERFREAVAFSESYIANRT